MLYESWIIFFFEILCFFVQLEIWVWKNESEGRWGKQTPDCLAHGWDVVCAPFRGQHHMSVCVGLPVDVVICLLGPVDDTPTV